MDNDNAVPWIAWPILVFLALTWGTSYILIKKSLIAFDPQEVATLRVGITALAFVPFAVAKFAKRHLQYWKIILLVIFFGNVFPAWLFAKAETEIPSSITGVLSSLTPLFTLFTGIIIFNRAVLPTKVKGVAIGLLGALVLMGMQGYEGFSGNVWYAFLILIGCFSYSIANNTVQDRLKPIDSLTINALGFSFFLLPSLCLIWMMDIPSKVLSHPSGWASLGAVTLLSLSSTFLASLMFFHLVKLKDAVFASMVSYLIPIVALGWGWYDGEALSWSVLIGMGLILYGLFTARK